MMELKNKKVLVLGMGASGQSAAVLLLDKGAVVSVSESSDDPGLKQRFMDKIGSDIPSETGAHTPSFCGEADLIVASPGIDIAPLYDDNILSPGIPVISELELGYSFCPAPVIAITGTNGKTTTTKLIGDILSRSGRHTVVCGNIGNPLSGEVKKLRSDSVAVVEVSSFQLERIKDFRPYIAVLLNISEDHYERHGSYDQYCVEKFNIFRNQEHSDWAVLHSDFGDKGSGGGFSDPLVDGIKSRLLFFGKEDTSAFVSDSGIRLNLTELSGFTINEDEVFLKGIHNLYNIAGALLVSAIMGVDRSTIYETIKNFKGLPHRFEKVTNINGVDFIDDSKATNIDATRRALESVAGKVVLIAGGIDKGGDYLSILPLVKEKVRSMVLIGEAAPKIYDNFSGCMEISFADNMAEAVESAAGKASSGETVLLSPMCSSFDMFSSYKERGEVFQKEVARLKTYD